MKIVADYGDVCGECPIWAAAEATLYWTDCGGSKFYGYDWASGRSVLLRENLEINGFRLNYPGGLIITNNSGVWLLENASATPRVLADEVAGQPCRMNDCVADKQGRLLACSWFYDPVSSYSLGRLLSFDNEGSATVLDEGFHLANGLAFSPDGSKLYVADSAQRIIFEYAYSVAKGSVEGRKILIRVPDSEGLPDGLKVDEQGFFWSAQWYGSQVVRYDPEGVVERRIAVPAKQVSSLTFGGPDLSTLFITTAKQSEPMPLMPPGYDAHVGPFGGPLFAMELEIRGLPDLPADITKA